MKQLLKICFLLCIVNQLNAQKNVYFPDILNYKTLKCDFHMHTIFSDGHVWPNFRVSEAVSEGLDVISITDHIEYLPHKDYLQFDHNTSYDIAKEYALKKGLILVKGTEITRSMPPGHLNAIFITDANALDQENINDVLIEAVAQGGFVFWNHPCWDAQQPDTVVWFDEHTEIYENAWMQGIEVINYTQYCPEALLWSGTKDLTVLANSDVHGSIADQYQGESRPLTLVFAEEHTEESVKKAMFDGRTLAFYDEMLYGKKDLLLAMFQASVDYTQQIDFQKRDDDYVGNMKWTNISGMEINIILEKDNDNIRFSKTQFTIPANASCTVQLFTESIPNEIELIIQVSNYIDRQEKPLMHTIKLNS